MSTSPGKPCAKTKKFAQKLRLFALSYPETREDHPWGHAAFKVNGKVFVFMGEDDTGLGISIKLKASHMAAMELPFTKPTHYGMGKHGWVSASFEPNSDVPLPLVESWIHESFGLIAPKRVLKAMTAGGLSQPAAAGAKAPRVTKKAAPPAVRKKAPAAARKKAPAASRKKAASGKKKAISAKPKAVKR